MRKIFIVAMVMMMFSSCAYGAVSEDMSVYLRRDVFEVYMQNINSNMERILQRLDKIEDDVNKRFDRLDTDINKLNQTVANLSGRVDGLEKRIDDLRNGIYLWLMAITLVVSWPKVREVLKNWIKPTPSITLDDVRGLVNELIQQNNALLEKKFQA